MKKLLLLIAYHLSLITFSQGQNLVPNGDFEQYSGCPTGYSQIDSCLNWMNPSIGGGAGSPDYFNQCSVSGIVGVPVNLGSFGYQQAQSGEAYTGGYLWVSGMSNVREYLEAPLTSTLLANECYHFEMYVNLANVSQFMTSEIGIYFSDTAVTGIPNYYPLPFTPQINNPQGNVFDTLNWTLVSGNYTAQGNEDFLIIGNFKDDANTNALTVNPNGGWPSAYVHIEDVSLVATPCTGIKEQNSSSEIKIYPNPVGDELQVQSSTFKAGEKTEVIITDALGKEVYKKSFLTSDLRLPTSGLKPGVYFLQINDGKNSYMKKFLKVD